MTIRQALNDIFFLAVGVVCCMGFYESCRQQTPSTVIRERVIKAAPDTVTITKVSDHRYTFTKHDTVQTISGYIVSPCDPDTVAIGYTIEQRCTVNVYQVPEASYKPVMVGAIAGPGIGAAMVQVPIKNGYVGGGYDFINRGPLITYSVALGRIKKK